MSKFFVLILSLLVLIIFIEFVIHVFNKKEKSFLKPFLKPLMKSIHIIVIASIILLAIKGIVFIYASSVGVGAGH